MALERSKADVDFVVAHWLAVEGVQPSIPQNPTTAEARASELVPKGTGANPTLAALSGNDNVVYKPSVKHILSKELILFFDKIKSAILDEDDDDEVLLLRKTALESVRADPGLHQLVPYFITFIAEKVTHGLNSLFILQQMMELASALTSNPTLFLDPYITYLMPAVLTCLIGRHLGTSPATTSDVHFLQQQYTLRRFSATLLASLAEKYTSSCRELRARTVRTCLECWLTPTRSLPEHYGAMLGIVACGGREAVRITVLPNVKLYETVLQQAEERIQERGGAGREELQMMVVALLQAIGQLVGGDLVVKDESGMQLDDLTSAEQLVVAKLGRIIGERIVAAKNSALNEIILQTNVGDD